MYEMNSKITDESKIALVLGLIRRGNNRRTTDDVIVRNVIRQENKLPLVGFVGTAYIQKWTSSDTLDILHSVIR